MNEYKEFYNLLPSTPLKYWLSDIEQIINWNLRKERYPQVDEWGKALSQIPNISPNFFDFKNSVRMNGFVEADLEEKLMKFHPWRKGPYFINSIHIDTEWRSDLKWERLAPHIKSLKNKTVLDIGCGNGYHMWRMLGEKAKLAVGIDPQPLFIFQFFAIKKIFGNINNIWVLPMRLEELPNSKNTFDTCFSMGVIYHRKNPSQHIKHIYEILKPGGEVILESLISVNPNNEDIIPIDRYAKMRNVWRIPSLKSLQNELLNAGFKNIRVIDKTKTKYSEQRKTNWMKFESLEDFLDPNDPNKTIEGYQSPIRAILIGEK